MKQLYIQETFVDDTNNAISHIGDVVETDVKSLKELYRALRKKGGRITKMFRGEGIHVGYIVTRKQNYDCSDDTYIESIWIELLEKVQVARVVNEYVPIGTKAAA